LRSQFNLGKRDEERNARGIAGVFKGRGVDVDTLAMARNGVAAFQGLPVINSQGGVVIRQDLSDAGPSILYGNGKSSYELANTRNQFTSPGRALDQFASLGRFPVCNDAEEVVFVATRRSGGEGIFKASLQQYLPPPELSPPGFVSFRGALYNNAGQLVFYGTPPGGTLGIYRGEERLIGLDDMLFGAQIIDFAPNPVSYNNSGQLALRVKLKDGRGFILRISSY
jgi:hypothetical protein